MEEREHYYVTFMGQGGGGVIVLDQIVHADGENPDGFNFIEATKYLRNLTGFPVVIMSWVKTTKKRKEQFELFMQEVTGAPSKKERPAHLSLVPLGTEIPPSL